MRKRGIRSEWERIAAESRMHKKVKEKEMNKIKNGIGIIALSGLALFAEDVMAQSSLYVKLRSNGEKRVTALKAGTVVDRASLPVKALAGEDFDVDDRVVSIGLSFAPETHGWYRLQCNDSEQIGELLDSLRADPMVEYVEKVPVRRVFSEPNDPYYQDSAVEGLNMRWHLDLIHASEAWDMCQVNPNLKVAVVDNAVWGEHEDLQIDTMYQYNAFTGERNSAPPDTVDNTVDCSAADFVQRTCAAYNWSHGTHGAGLIGALNNNGIGIASVAGGVTLMGVSCGANDGLDILNTGEGIAYAVENGAKVINMSFGNSEFSRAEHAIIREAANAGVIFVASAGNDGVNDMTYPAAYPEVISVGSCDYDKNISVFSNYGGWVDILAPGGYGPNESSDYMFSTTFCRSQDLATSGYEEFAGKYYDRMLGTSMAAPVVSAVVALMLSQDSTLDYRDVRSILMESAQPSLTSGIAENSGVLDAAEALRMVSTYVKPYEPVCLQSMSVMKEEGDLVPDIYWNYDHSVDGSQVSLRLYRDNLLVADNIPLDAECFSDSTAQGGHVHCYELCEVNADGKESYRLMDLVDMPEQHNLFLTASPAEAGIVSGAGMYEYGSVAVIIAEANPGWKFDYWSMGSTMFSEMDSTGVLINSDSRLTAMFSSETSNEDAAASAMPAIRLVPNPADDVFALQGADAGLVDEVLLFNTQGRLLKSWPAGEGYYEIGALESGLYMVAVRMKDGRNPVLKLMVR